MKLGIMQPYFFPYLGYFQLVAAVDKFVFYDDVSYIKQGWINRNAILSGGQRHVFTVPLRSASSFALIRDTMLDAAAYARWCGKFLKTLTQNYIAAPYYDPVYALVEQVLHRSMTSIGHLAISSVLAVASYLDLRTLFVTSSAIYENAELKGTERVLDICRRECAQTYYNSIGGKELYSKEEFSRHGVELKFIETRSVRYQQFGQDFVPSLSIIDALMFNPKEAVQAFLQE
jgi:hypothetical protein